MAPNYIRPAGILKAEKGRIMARAGFAESCGVLRKIPVKQRKILVSPLEFLAFKIMMTQLSGPADLVGYA